MILYFIILTFVGIISMIFGFLIWQKKKLNLINGFDPEKITDCESYGTAMGKNLIYLGIFSIANGVISFIDILPIYIVNIVFIVGMIVLITNFSVITKKFSKKTY